MMYSTSRCMDRKKAVTDLYSNEDIFLLLKEKIKKNISKGCI